MNVFFIKKYKQPQNKIEQIISTIEIYLKSNMFSLVNKQKIKNKTNKS